jgi:nucleolar protein 6
MSTYSTHISQMTNSNCSAGGGGNSENRKSRILAKNDKLHDERARDREKRAELELKQSERKEKKEAKGKKGTTAEEAEEEAQPDNAGMHPARLAMMQAPARPMHRQRY